MLALLLLACTPTSLHVDGRPDRDRPAAPEVEDTDVEHVPDNGPVDTGGTGEHDPDDTVVFNLDVVHTVEITLGRAERASLAADPYTYVPADLTFDGEVFPNVGVRLKGRLGSFRSIDGKAALKIDLLEMGEGAKLHGLEKINLNNMVQDCAKAKELAAYAIHRAVGIPAPRVAYAEVTIDGEARGLYSLVEDYDDEFLQANFADPSGNLYDGDYYLWPNGSYTLVDFTTAGDPYFTLDEGTDVGLTDVQAVTAAVTAAGGGLDGVGALVDLDQHADFLAVAAWTGHYDSYSYYSNNYRVYFDPGRGGRAVLLPWDPDWAFYSATPVTTPYGVLSQACLRDVGCRDRVEATIGTLSATIPGSSVEAEVAAAVALTGEALARDPLLEQRPADIRACQADLPAWFARRGGELDAAGL